jgi:hypothetical protein
MSINIIYMLTISKLIANFKALNTDVLIQESLTETMPAFEKVQKEQLKAGKNNKGETIAPKYRNKKYAIAKATQNPLPGLGTPDLFLTGKFYAGIDAEVGNGVIDIISKDDKGPALEDKYPAIFGLGTDFKKEYLDKDLRPLVHKKISTFTQLKFT